MEFSEIRQNLSTIKMLKLLVASLLVGFLAGLLGLSLKSLTEYYEHRLFGISESSGLLMFVFPFVGLSIIYLLRLYLFNRKQNKGITEIFECTQKNKNTLPLFKIPSHFLNGLITVAFGGSTGVEVSTVVASAAIGTASKKEYLLRNYKTELICAGVAAGITALFSSPFAGILFSYEVIARKFSRIFIFTTGVASIVAFFLTYFLGAGPLFQVAINTWNYAALPYIVLLGLLAGLNSVYLTRCVMITKRTFGKIDKGYIRIVAGSVILGVIIVLLPQLYGDGYHAVAELLHHPDKNLTLPLALTFSLVLLAKPIATSVTLASGGDGGVFGPSLFIGAMLGLFCATVLNSVFDAHVIPVNFMVIGMAAVLSGSIHAPLTAIFLICGLVGNYTLFIPIAACSFISKYTAQFIYPKTVYSIGR